MTGMNPADMLPDEMWEELISHLRNPLDKISLVKTHPWLESGPFAKINEWHFLSVLPIILEQMNDTKTLDEFQSEVLNWRMITSSCRTLIDRFLYYHEDFCCMFASREKVERFTKEFNVPGGFIYSSSLIMKKFTGVCEVPNRANIPTPEEMTELLRKIGPHLKWVALGVTVQDAGRAGVINAELMSLVPNVETFLIRFTLPLPNEAGTEPVAFPEIPTLPNLRNLCIKVKYRRNPNGQPLNLPLNIPWPDLSKTFPNLVSLSLSLPLWKEEYNQSGLFPNLETLEILHSKLDIQKTEEKLFKIFWNLHAPKLETVSLIFHSTFRNDKSLYFLSTLISLAIKNNNLTM